MEKILHRILFNAANRKSTLERMQRQTTAMLIVGGLALLVMFVGFATGKWPLILIVLLCLAALGAFIWLGRERQSDFDPGPIARTIEQEHPDLRALLITAVEQKPSADGQMNYLQHKVIETTLEEARKQKWVNFVDESEIRSAKFKRMLWTLLAWVSVVVLGFFGFRSAFDGSSAIVPPVIELPSFLDQAFEVTPGDVEIEKGSRLPVSIQFNAANIPTKVDLMIGSDAENLRLMPAVKNLEDPVFGVVVPEVNEASVYKFSFGDQESKIYKISIFEFPRLESANATVSPPEYTSLEKKTLKDITFVNAVEQSSVRFDMILNKPVKSAKLVARGDEKQEIVLEADAQSPEIFVAKLTATKTVDFDLFLVDSEGRENKDKDRITLNVLKNGEPMVKIKFPGRDVDLSPIEELQIEAEISDDFGLQRYGISYDFKEESKEIVIAEPKGKELEGKIAHTLSMEDLKAEADDLFAYIVWAEDIGPDGEIRRVSSDMFFAEIRPFEKTYREATGQGDEQQQQQQGQQGGAGEQLVKLQKDVMNATWKVIRNHDKPEDELEKDLEAITEAQKQVALMIEEAMAQAEGEAQEFMKQAIEHIEKAVPQLQKATQNKSVDPLDEALKEERAAYQALLRLRAREVNVRRGQPGQGGQAQSDADQEQIDNMKLREEERRYETESEAEKQRLEQQREQQQENSETQKYLERLKDLARRQEGIDDQIKDLQIALDMAETEEEKEEIMRQLKRLREEQRDLLRDLDEMREDLNAPERRELSDTREELDQVRENIQQTADALNQADTDAAANASTRARESLEELKDDVRERTGSQFKEQMRDLREQARELATNQGEITSEIQKEIDGSDEESAEPKPRQRQSLDAEESTGTNAKIEAQKKRLEELTKEMKRLTQESELPEPLLSKKLYDALREVKPERLGDRMDDTVRDLDRDRPESAQARNQATSEDIDKLAEAIEDAARSVLGNERESLELAQNELRDLVDQVENQAGVSEGQPSQQVQPGQEGQPSQQGQPGQEGQPGQPGGTQPSNQPAQPGQPGVAQPGGLPQPGGINPTPGLQPGIQPPQPGGTPQPGTPQPPTGDNSQAQPGTSQPDTPNPEQGLQPGVQPQPSGQQPGGQQPDGQQPGGEQPGGEQPGGQQPGGEQPGGEQPGGEQPGGEQPGGQQPGGQQPGGQQPGGQQPGGEQPGGEQPGGEQPGGQQPGGQQPGGQQPGGQQPGGQQPGGQQPGGQQPGGQQPGGQQPGGQQPGGQQPGGQQPGGEQPGGQQPGGQQPGGQQPGGQPGEQPDGQQPGGEQPGGEQGGGGGQPSGQSSDGPKQNPGQGSQGDPQNAPGEGEGGQQPGGQGEGGQQPGGQQPGRGPRPSLDGSTSPNSQTGGPGGTGRPQEGNNPSGPQQTPQTPDEAMKNWIEQLGDIQDILDDPEMRDSAGQVKDDVKDMLRELKRSSKLPTEETIKNYVLNPLGELNERVEEELARLGDDQAKLVPIDKDPVPEAYSELVQKYYEELGKGE